VHACPNAALWVFWLERIERVCPVGYADWQLVGQDRRGLNQRPHRPLNLTTPTFGDFNHLVSQHPREQLLCYKRALLSASRQDVCYSTHTHTGSDAMAGRHTKRRQRHGSISDWLCESCFIQPILPKHSV
jgi:hypothetical protein